MVVPFNFIWCHGTECHKNHTQDGVRGYKGSKFLRTRKVKQHIDREWYRPDQVYNYFCSQACLHNYIRTHLQRIVALDPRTEPLETPIQDPVREKHTSNYSFGEHSYYTTTIKEKVDNNPE